MESNSAALGRPDPLVRAEQPDPDRWSALVAESFQRREQSVYGQQPGVCGAHLSRTRRAKHLGLLVWECSQQRAVLRHRMGLAAGRQHAHQRDPLRLWYPLQQLSGIERLELDRLGLRSMVAAGDVRYQL